LKQNYLALDLTPSDRAEALIFHYRVLRGVFSRSIARLRFAGVVVWTRLVPEHGHQISLQFSQRVHYEGELTLCYWLDGRELYWLSFSFVNGETVGTSDPIVVFVTRLQIWETYEYMRAATRSLNDIAPPLALATALEGVARALRIEALVGVNASSQASVVSGRYLNVQTYDNFFQSLGAARLCELEPALRGRAPARAHPDYFRVGVPMPEKPIEHIARSHRSRTKAKRRFRREISDAVRGFTERLIGMDAPTEPPARLTSSDR
jgi:uncharacterized protein VirK/YbjX